MLEDMTHDKEVILELYITCLLLAEYYERKRVEMGEKESGGGGERGCIFKGRESHFFLLKLERFCLFFQRKEKNKKSIHVLLEDTPPSQLY